MFEDMRSAIEYWEDDWNIPEDEIRIPVESFLDFLYWGGK